MGGRELFQRSPVEPTLALGEHQVLRLSAGGAERNAQQESRQQLGYSHKILPSEAIVPEARPSQPRLRGGQMAGIPPKAPVVRLIRTIPKRFEGQEAERPYTVKH